MWTTRLSRSTASVRRCFSDRGSVGATTRSKQIKLLELSAQQGASQVCTTFTTIVKEKDAQQNNNNKQQFTTWKRTDVSRITTTSQSKSTTQNDTSVVNKIKINANKLIQNVLLHFLPLNFPASVAPGYDKFALYGFGASVAGSAAMVLSTQTLLVAIVGQHVTPVFAGALNWVLKDGVGQLGGVIYAIGRMRLLDARPKQFRLVSSIVLDTANAMEIYAPLLPPTCILPVACLANVLKNIAFLTASASRAALHQALTRHDNLGDVTVKAGTQSMAASLLGTSMGIGISTIITSHDYFAVAFIVTSVLHQVGTYSSIRNVPLAHFDMPRLWLVVNEYINNETRKSDNKGDDGNSDNKNKVLTPVDVARVESLFSFNSVSNISIGESIADKHTLLLICEKYVISVDNNNKHHYYLTFMDNATGADMIRGVYHVACINSQQWCDTTNDKFLLDIKDAGWKVDCNTVRIEPRNAVRVKVVE